MLIFYVLKRPNNIWEGNYKVANAFKLTAHNWQK